MVGSKASIDVACNWWAERLQYSPDTTTRQRFRDKLEEFLMAEYEKTMNSHRAALKWNMDSKVPSLPTRKFDEYFTPLEHCHLEELRKKTTPISQELVFDLFFADRYTLYLNGNPITTFQNNREGYYKQIPPEKLEPLQRALWEIGARRYSIPSNLMLIERGRVLFRGNGWDEIHFVPEKENAEQYIGYARQLVRELKETYTPLLPQGFDFDNAEDWVRQRRNIVEYEAIAKHFKQPPKTPFPTVAAMSAQLSREPCERTDARTAAEKRRELLYVNEIIHWNNARAYWFSRDKIEKSLYFVKRPKDVLRE